MKTADEHKTVVIVDYKMGNLFNVKHACAHVGANVVISSEKSEIINARALILPGVGAFGNAMENLYKLDLVGPIKDHVGQGKPLVGICLGMQLLFDRSYEFGEHQGLGIIKGCVSRLPSEIDGRKLHGSQIGWNPICRRKGKFWENTPFAPLSSQEYMYFVHSYYAKPEQEDVILSVTPYEGVMYCSSILSGNIFAMQFHPERSGLKGLEIYQKIKGDFI